MNNENPEESPSGAQDGHPPTGNFPAYVPPPPGSSYPSQPQWATAAAAPAPSSIQLRFRDHLLVGLSVVVAMIVVVGLGYMWIGDSTISVQRIADQATANSGQNALQDPGNAPASGPANGVDLRNGGVYLASNDKTSNVVAAFARGDDGALREVGRYPTGGTGSGTVEDTSNGIILGSPEGEASPQHMVDKGEFLFVPNLGSNTITVFKVKADGLESVGLFASGGEKPMSLAISHGLLYVMNSGEFNDHFITSPTTFIDNCTTGQLPSVTGFRVASDGKLTQIPNSTRLLSGAAESGCAQIGFTPDGKTLFATERIAGKTDKATGYQKGAIIGFAVRTDGTLEAGNVIEPAQNAPYGFTFTSDGSTMLTVGQNGGFLNEHGGEAASYDVDGANLTPIGKGAIKTLGTDTCWIALHNNQKLVFASSPFSGGAISSYRVERDGSMTLLYPNASADDGQNASKSHLTDGVLDIALSHDSKFLYGLDGLSGGVWSMKVNDNGTLTFLGRTQVFNVLSSFTEGGEGGPNGLSVF